MFLTEGELAARWRISVKALQKWRVQGGGPRFHKFGSAVRYAKVAIEEFERRADRGNTSQ
jgi:hypothetical protein